MDCGYGHGECKAPETQCPHWQGTFCELDKEAEEQETERNNFRVSSVLYRECIDLRDKVEKYIKEHPEILEEASRKYLEQFVDIKDVALGNKDTYTFTLRDCHKCVYEIGCHGNPLGCKKYKRDAPDGGYYG